LGLFVIVPVAWLQQGGNFNVEGIRVGYAYPKAHGEVSELTATTENDKQNTCLPQGAVVSLCF
jgi:hypothetical protein